MILAIIVIVTLAIVATLAVAAHADKPRAEDMEAEERYWTNWS